MGLIQDRYALPSGRAASKIMQMEATIEHMQAKTEMLEERIRTLLEMRKDNALQMIANRLQRGQDD